MNNQIKVFQAKDSENNSSSYSQSIELSLEFQV